MLTISTPIQPATEDTNVASLEGINKAFNESCLLAVKHDSEMGGFASAQLEMGAVASTAIDAHMTQFGVSRWDAIETLAQTRVVSSNGLFAFMAVGRLFQGKTAVGVHPQQLIAALASVNAEDRKAVWASIARQTPAEAIATRLKAQAPKKESVPRTEAQTCVSLLNSIKKNGALMTPAQKAEAIAILSA